MNETLYMQRCLELAQKAKGHTAPNPMVGAVLVYNGHIIGEGYHKQYGQAHAEVNCLTSVSETNRHLIPDSIMYVSLEPCAHYGKTPPCATRIVAEGIKKVVIANTDPFEKVSGRGLQILRDAGIAVDIDILDQEAAWVNRRFFTFHRHRRPYIILKWAQSPDGYIAPADSSRLQISNELSKRLVHKWRTEEAAIMIGTNTAINDNPQLTARLWAGKQPLRILLDRNLRVPSISNIYDTATNTWVINELKEERHDNIHFIKFNFDKNFLRSLSERLHKAGILSVIIEGGTQLLSSFIHEGLWDEARVFTGDISLQNGISAPSLQNGILSFDTQLENNTLKLFTNKNSGYRYLPGLEL